jgi:hypothetical protein
METLFMREATVQSIYKEETTNLPIVILSYQERGYVIPGNNCEISCKISEDVAAKLKYNQRINILFVDASEEEK